MFIIGGLKIIKSYTLEDLKWDKIIIFYTYYIMFSHKSEDYKLQAVKYYLKK